MIILKVIRFWRKRVKINKKNRLLLIYYSKMLIGKVKGINFGGIILRQAKLLGIWNLPRFRFVSIVIRLIRNVLVNNIYMKILLIVMDIFLMTIIIILGVIIFIKRKTQICLLECKIIKNNNIKIRIKFKNWWRIEKNPLL